MTRLLASIVLGAALVGVATAQTAPPTATPGPQMVSVSAKGTDVRNVLSDLFGQAKKSFVIEPNIRFVLYLSLADMEFEEALQLICKTAGLSYEIQNGIHFVGKSKPTQVSLVTSKPQGHIPFSDLRKKVNAKVQKQDIRELFKNLSTQTSVAIEVNGKVPSYKLDATLKDVTLKFALETVCKAADLHYRLTDSMSIEIYPTESDSHVTLHAEAAIKGM